MSSSNDSRRTRSSRRQQTSATSNGTTSSQSDGSQRSSRHANSTTSYKTYFEDNDNYDPEIIDVQNDNDSQKSLSQTPSKSTTRSKQQQQHKSNDNNQANIEQLQSITGLSHTEATSLLEACENNIERAIEIHFNNNSSSVSTSNTNTNNTSKLNGNAKATKRTHTDLDNDLIQIDEDSCSSSNGHLNNGDYVRAPIPPKMDRLVDYDPYAIELAAQNAAKRSRTTFDGFRNMREEFNDGLSGSSKGFSALFRPPIDLLFDGSFEASKVKACQSNKWLMLNVQCQTDFSSRCLNRDIWSNETVKEIIKANFVFVQVYYDSVEGNKLRNIYNINTYPFVGILDPRTGEKLIQYQANKLDPCSFCEKLYSFLGENEADFKQNLSNSEIIIDPGENSNKSDDVVIVDKNSNLNGSSKTYINGFTSKKSDKPKKAADILNSNLIETNEDSNSDIIDINNQEEDEEINKKLKSYEDDSVISKDKYDKMKQATSTEITSTSSSKPTNINQTNQIKESITTKNSTNSENNHQPQILKYQSEINDKKDCYLRILYPNGDRLDFTTNGESHLKELVDYLINQGFNTKQYELIERLMPHFNTPSSATSSRPTTSANADTQSFDEPVSILDITQQSRNLFNSNLDLTFKQLKLFPRVFLLLQES